MGSPGATPHGGSGAARSDRVGHIGCVSYLNSRPLIDGLEDMADTEVRFDVPSRLLDDLLAGAVDIALCPVIDYFTCARPLEIVPVGGIACRGRTHTVRVFSRVPLSQVEEVRADTDSHTSVQLARIVLAERFGRRPRIVGFHAGEQSMGLRPIDRPACVLLIGDKVVTDAPPDEQYPHQLDLGEAWRELTDLPFVFAVWMCPAGADLGNLPARLATQLQTNLGRLDEIVARHAPRHGWPLDLAQQYLSELLHFQIGPAELGAIERFGQLAHRHGAAPAPAALRLRRV